MTRDDAELKPPGRDRDHSQGRPMRRVTLVEYGDYECPHCGRAFPIVKEVQRALGDGSASCSATSP